MKYLTNFLAKLVDKLSRLLKLKAKILCYGLKIKSIISVFNPCITPPKASLEGMINVSYPRITWKKRTIKYNKNLINSGLNTDNEGTLNLSSSIGRQFTEMLTIEKKVSQVEELVKQAYSKLDHGYNKSKNSSPKIKSSRNVKDRILNNSSCLNLLAKTLEDNWEDFAEEKNISQLKVFLQLTNETIKTLEKSEIAENKFKGFGDTNLHEELKILKKSLVYLSQVIEDTIQFVDIASEITELRSKPVNIDVAEKVQRIFDKSQEICLQKKELSKEETRSDIERILGAIRKN